MGFGVKVGGAVISSALGVAGEYIVTGKMPSNQSLAETSAIAIASVLGGPPAGVIVGALIEFVKLGNVESESSNLIEFTRIERLLERALGNPDGPEAAYFRALANDSQQDIARGAMNLPHMEQDGILRAAAGYGVYDPPAPNDNHGGNESGNPGGGDSRSGGGRSGGNGGNESGNTSKRRVGANPPSALKQNATSGLTPTLPAALFAEISVWNCA